MAQVRAAEAGSGHSDSLRGLRSGSANQVSQYRRSPRCRVEACEEVGGAGTPEAAKPRRNYTLTAADRGGHLHRPGAETERRPNRHPDQHARPPPDVQRGDPGTFIRDRGGEERLAAGGGLAAKQALAARAAERNFPDSRLLIGGPGPRPTLEAIEALAPRANRLAGPSRSVSALKGSFGAGGRRPPATTS